MSGSVLKIPGQGKQFTSLNAVQLLNSGLIFFSTLESLILEAKDEIFFETYIFESDETGTRIANALIETAKRGVRIYLLLDAFGSQDLSHALQEKMIQAGINLRKYGRFYSSGSFHIGRRLHRKVIVIDGQSSVVGGINISDPADHYNGR